MTSSDNQNPLEKSKVKIETTGLAVKKKEEIEDSFKTPRFCVGIGASAGGLEALEQFFKNMNPQSGLAFVVVQHLSPDYKSLMVELLSKHTEMKVYRAEDGMQVNPNCVYLIPPKKNMTIFHSKLFLTEQNYHHGINLPIDIFFRSLAEDYCEKAIGVILSGTGSDGTLGIRAIKGNGGMVMAQDDNSAKFDGMPKSAIATGLVDYILSSDKMPNELLKYVKHPLTSKGQEKQDLTHHENTLGKIMSIIRNRVGVDFTYYKPNTIIRRLERRISINQINNFENYILFLEQSPKEINILYKELLIGVTKFFRDQESFDIIKKEIIPRIFKNKKKEESIRLWSVGCSTGEEAYSLAILIKEFMEQNNLNNDVKIFATDLDKESIEYGSLGFYPESIVADISVERLRNFFLKKEKGYQISESIRKMVIFATHNIIKDPPFSKIDLISCRNMLIYLKPVMQKKVLSLFHFSLHKNGFLFLGSSESLGELSRNFTTISSKWKIYSYKEGIAGETVNDFLIPSLQKTKTPIDKNDNFLNLTQKPKEINEEIYSSILEEFIPPSIIVDENYQIVHIFKDVNKYLKLPSGKISIDILHLVRKELNTAINIAVHKSVNENKEIIYKDFKIKERDEIHVFNIRVRPLKDKNKGRKLILIIFEEKKNIEKTNSNIENQTIEYDSNQQIKDLELELKYTKENLQATIEELGTSNEELQATNEELISSNEELQSTNEELQSVNEELYTVNSEYQNKIEELTQLNNDINNLLKNTNIGTVFLDRNLLIRKFTPAVTSAINILDLDIGRPIHHISHNTLYDNFIEDIENVLKTLVPKEIQIKGKKNNWFLMRILPYRTIENAIDGVVITFVDITERKEFEEKIERKNALLITVLDNSPIASTILDKNGHITYANHMAEQILGITKNEILKRTFNASTWKITDEQGNDFPEEKLPYNLVKKTRMSVFEVIHNIQWNDGKVVTLSINGSPIFDDKNQIDGVVCTMLDITKKRKLEEKLRRDYELLIRILENSPNAKIMADKNGNITFGNKLFFKFFNIKPETLEKGLNFNQLNIKNLEPLNGKDSIINYVVKNKKSCYGIKHEFISKQRQEVFLLTASPDFDDNNNVSGVIISIDQNPELMKKTNYLKKQQNALMNMFPMGIFTLDLSSSIQSWNKEAEKITGTSADDVLYKKCFAISNPKNKKPEPCFIYENKNKPFLCQKLKIVLKDKTIFLTTKKIDFIHTEEGNEVMGAIGYFEDVNIKDNPDS
ncbi:MAG: chemotaxis protein CheB [Bacteroidota bacterium]